MEGMADWLDTLGRLLLGGLFVAGGIRHHFMVPALVDVMRKRGVPMPRETLAIGSVFQTIVGAMLILDIWPALSALGLVGFTILASVMFLNFWDMPAGHERDGALNNVLTNIAVIGGLLVVAGGAL